MRNLYFFVLSLLLCSFTVMAQTQVFNRTAVIPAAPEGGFGNIVAGVDFDGDGKLEIYAVNNNTVDLPGGMVPRITKYELNGTQWDSVWGAVTDIPLQNTWPALTTGDLDKDGKPEIIWGPANYLDATSNPNPPRVIVYEYPGDGSDNMGVSDGFGGFIPNAKTSIHTTDMTELRPFRFQVLDIDGDNVNELVYCDRNSITHFGILSVSNIPDDGNGSEVWTIETWGKDNTVLAGSGAKYDMAILNNVIYLFNADGKFFQVKKTGADWVVTPISGFGGSSASFKSSQVVDINNDGTKEIITAQWNAAGSTDTSTVYVLVPSGDTLMPYNIGSFRSFGGMRLNGGDYGDLDNDGKFDYVVGTRNGGSPNNLVFRIEYQGGSITDPNSYVRSAIDSSFFAVGGDLDMIDIGNLDGDAAMEVAYSSAYPRGSNEDSTMAIVVLDLLFTPVDIRADYSVIPEQFTVSQNYPNPFNPSTTIKFDLPFESAVELTIYNSLGEQVKKLLSNEIYMAGSYTLTFDASDLASGTYVYKFKAGDYSISKKMMLIK